MKIPVICTDDKIRGPANATVVSCHIHIGMLHSVRGW